LYFVARNLLLICSRVDGFSDSKHFMIDEDQGWISRRGEDGVYRRVCWLPHERRHNGVIACWDDRVCVGSESGAVTILDFSDFMNKYESIFEGNVAL
jgi:hypothetical protein